MSDVSAQVSCIILAGGEGKRLGGADKGLLEYMDRPLIEHVINIVSSQVDDIVISANRNIDRYRHYSRTVVADEADRYLGPLAGIAATLPYCCHDQVLVVACDTPFLPDNMVDKFLSEGGDSGLCIAQTNDRLQLVMLINKSLYESIKQSLEKRQLSLMQWAREHHPAIVTFEHPDAFKNFNIMDDFHP